MSKRTLPIVVASLVMILVSVALLAQRRVSREQMPPRIPRPRSLSDVE